MKELTFSLVEQSGTIQEAELQGAIEACAPLLETVQQGEAQYAGTLGWHKVATWAGSEWLDRYETLARRVQADADVLVVVGIGGSNQAARAVVDALGERGKTRIVWGGNSISAHSINEVLASLEGQRVYIDVIAKNFETLEPGIAFRALRSWLREHCGADYARRVICTGTEGSRLEGLCQSEGYTFLPFPEEIGGRFTALSPVGLFPMAVAGLNIRAMAAGAAHMEHRLKSETAENNMALRFAALRNLLYRKGYRMEMLAFFEPRLFRFAKWWMQLFGESEGKDDLGLYPIYGSYSEDLHSIGQFIQSGTPVIYEVFLDVETQDSSCVLGGQDIDDGFGYLDGKDFHDINKAAFQATVDAHSRRFPCVVLGIPALDEETFGQLFYFFEFTCYLSGKMLGVNPFDQPGVEAYKNRMFKILGKKGS